MNDETLLKIYKVGLNLEGLCLAGCGIRKLPDNLFHFLPIVKHVDFRHNLLLSLPSSLAFHPTVEVLLLAGNLFMGTPSLLSTLPRLQIHGLAESRRLKKKVMKDLEQFSSSVGTQLTVATLFARHQCSTCTFL